MTPDQEYDLLLRMLPKDLTPDELAGIRTTGFPFSNPAHMMVKTAAVNRAGWWYGVLIFIHARGVVGHVQLRRRCLPAEAPKAARCRRGGGSGFRAPSGLSRANARRSQPGRV
jgi:hypothetical protein